MNLLTIDAGNSRCKVCFGKIDSPMPSEMFGAFELKELESRLANFSAFDYCVVSSVNSEASSKIRKLLSTKIPANGLLFVNSKNSPLELQIESPETLGADRLAAAYAAYHRANGAAIIIDSGTAVTVDRVNQAGGFEGGVIFPGINLAFQSLTHHTDKLPKVSLETGCTPDFFGKETKTAMQSGVFWSQVGAIERIVENYRADLGTIPIYFTGGNGKVMCNETQLEGQFIEQLVLEGLWEFGLSRVSESCQ